MKFTPVTLCFPLRDAATGTEVLLGLKRTGFGIGKIVGIGGHVEPGESDAEAVVREVWEETGIVVLQEDLAHAVFVKFIFPARPEWNMSCRLFTTRRWDGEPAESQEITPEWFDFRVVCRWNGCGRMRRTGCPRRWQAKRSTSWWSSTTTTRPLRRSGFPLRGGEHRASGRRGGVGDWMMQMPGMPRPGR